MTSMNHIKPLLYHSALAPSTHRIYNNNINKLIQHIQTRLKQKSFSLKTLLSLHHKHIDNHVSQWINHMYESGGSFDYASQCIQGLTFYSPILRFRLYESRMCLRGWKRIRLSKSHPPITWELTVVFASTMARWGHHAEAVATLIAFDCLLRVGELTSIILSDVVMPNDPRVGQAHHGMALRLPKTKTGTEQWVSMYRKRVGAVLRFYIKMNTFKSNDRIFPFSPGQFNRLIHEVSISLGLGSIPYVAHSFRHGGATCAYLNHDSIESIVYRGRWRQMESARRYIQTGRALLITLAIPNHLNTTGHQIGKELLACMSHLLSTVTSRKYTQQRRVRFNTHTRK